MHCSFIFVLTIRKPRIFPPPPPTKKIRCRSTTWGDGVSYYADLISSWNENTRSNLMWGRIFHLCSSAPPAWILGALLLLFFILYSCMSNDIYPAPRNIPLKVSTTDEVLQVHERSMEKICSDRDGVLGLLPPSGPWGRGSGALCGTLECGKGS